jgi:mRNA interferase RelE/StbE
LIWTIQYERQAERAIDALDPVIRRRVVNAIGVLAADPRASRNVKALQGQPGYRLRVGDWRVIYDLQDDVLKVLVISVAHRREAYR